MPRKQKKSQQKNPRKSTELHFTLSDQFRQDYLDSSEQNQNDIDNTLRILAEHKKFTTGMKPQKLIRDIWYLRAGGDARITFSRKPDNELYLRRCGDHRILKKETNP